MNPRRIEQEMDGAIKGKNHLETQVLIIGGGLTGAGVARDLALRGVRCVLVEKDDVNAGASGRNHGLLHSGARYVSNDPATAEECRDEARLLKQLAPESIEQTGGLFVACPGDDENYIAEFPGLCERSRIVARPMDLPEARRLEPELAEDIIAAYWVDDARVDPFKLCFDTIADAEAHGAVLLTHAQAVAMERRGDRVHEVRLLRRRTGEELVVRADQIVNAGGAWSSRIAGLAGLDIPLTWSKGSVLITHHCVSGRIINRLRPPADGDIVVPGGTVSLVGTTSVRTDQLDNVRATFAEVDFLVEETAKMLPVLNSIRYIRSFAGVRPLLAAATGEDDRALSRGFAVIDHETEGLGNLVTIVGGKLTTYRLMAEKTADVVCRRLGVKAPCRTRELPVPSTELTDRMLPGSSSRLWWANRGTEGMILCECELVPASTVRRIVEQLHASESTFDFAEVCLRSRMGKGACQGAFCSFRAAAYCYELGGLTGEAGLDRLADFLERRWRGMRPVLWGAQMAQAQLQEAFHCGLLGLELTSNRTIRTET